VLGGKECVSILTRIRVGRGERTSARYYLRRQVDIDALLDVFIEARRRSSLSG